EKDGHDYEQLLRGRLLRPHAVSSAQGCFVALPSLSWNYKRPTMGTVMCCAFGFDLDVIGSFGRSEVKILLRANTKPDITRTAHKVDSQIPLRMAVVGTRDPSSHGYSSALSCATASPVEESHASSVAYRSLARVAALWRAHGH